MGPQGLPQGSVLVLHAGVWPLAARRWRKKVCFAEDSEKHSTFFLHPAFHPV